MVLAQDEARALNHDYIGTEHILLGIVRENQGVAARILLDFDVDADLVRKTTTDVLSGSPVPTVERPRIEVRPLGTVPLASGVGSSSGVALLVAGAAIFVVALAIGLLVGYLIWR